MKDIINLNGISGIDYAEPFAGGCGLALSLLRDGYVSHVYLNDLDSAIFAFWSSVLEETSELCSLIRDTPITIEQWRRCKEVLSTPSEYSLLEFGFATFFLNRTNYSGIIEGGVIGGLKQNSHYNIDCRFNKIELIHRIELIASRKNDISLSCFDAREFIRNVINNNPIECLTFLDPPYYKKGQQLYFSTFNHEDHLELAKVIQSELEEPWIVTYDDAPEINAMYSLSHRVHYPINYSVSTKRKGIEIMYYSPNLKIPLF
jgi:DNA adenine methylase